MDFVLKAMDGDDVIRVNFWETASRRRKAWGGKGILELTAWVGADCSNPGLQWWAGGRLPCATENQSCGHIGGAQGQQEWPFPVDLMAFGAGCGGWGKGEPSGFFPFVNFQKTEGKVGKESQPHIHGMETPYFFSFLFTPPPTTLCSPSSSSLWQSPWGNRTLASIGLLSNSACFCFLFCFISAAMIPLTLIMFFILHKMLCYTHSELGT